MVNTRSSERGQESSRSSTSVPRSVLDRIMSKVPLQVLLKWRLVSKEWNEVIMSRQWTSHTNLRSQRSIPLLIMNSREASLNSAVLVILPSNDRTNRWRKIQIDLKEASDLYQRCRHHNSWCSEFLRCTTAGSLGLMFFTKFCAFHSDSDFSLLVYNPLTKKLKPLEVPEVSEQSCVYCEKASLRLAGVIMDRDEKYYKLLFFTVTEKIELTFRIYAVYDSQTCSWKFRASEPEIPPLFHITSRVTCSGCFYFLHTSLTVETDEKAEVSPLFRPQLGIYDSEADRWYGVQESMMPKHEGTSYFPQLVQHKGTVFYLVLCESELQQRGVDESPFKTWCFFRLNQPDQMHDAAAYYYSASAVTWTRVREMPRSLFQVFEVYTRDFHEEDTGRHDVCCEGQGDFIYFYCVKPSNRLKPSISGYGSAAAGRRGPVEGVVLLHDFERNDWRFLRRYPPFGKDDYSSIKLESFRPSFVDV